MPIQKKPTPYITDDRFSDRLEGRTKFGKRVQLGDKVNFRPIIEHNLHVSQKPDRSHTGYRMIYEDEVFGIPVVPKQIRASAYQPLLRIQHSLSHYFMNLRRGSPSQINYPYFKMVQGINATPGFSSRPHLAIKTQQVQSASNAFQGVMAAPRRFVKVVKSTQPMLTYQTYGEG
jgi:hypothetical protein